MGQQWEASIVPQISSCRMKLRGTVYNFLEIFLLGLLSRNYKMILSEEKNHTTYVSEVLTALQIEDL